jgi:hypothetical protein
MAAILSPMPEGDSLDRRRSIMLGIGSRFPEFKLAGGVPADATKAVNGCGKSVLSGERTLREYRVSREAPLSAVRIASVMHAVAGVLDFENARAA